MQNHFTGHSLDYARRDWKSSPQRRVVSTNWRDGGYLVWVSDGAPLDLLKFERAEMRLKEAILKASKVHGIDPYLQAFKPADLGIKASDYGSFSDHCSENETLSGKWHPDVILKVAEWTATGKPRKYLLR